jgi:hypothetical protein
VVVAIAQEEKCTKRERKKKVEGKEKRKIQIGCN